MKPSVKSAQPVIFQTANIDNKIYIREQSGYFQRIRRYINIMLVSAFIILPLLRYQGHQAIYFDLARQKFTFFTITLFPQDLLIFSLIAILAATLLFYFSKLYGRIWCGYTCPQTVWMLMFNWIERRVEGSHRHSQSLDRSPISLNKIIKKVIKHSLWLLLSLFTALVFISYFVPVDTLYQSFFTLEAGFIVQAWVLFFMACTYLNGGWIKDKMCLHICPYARFQSVMFTAETKLITYDATRGESRGARKISQEKPESKGDCVDCHLCVDVCPVGIDIRDGLQYECINCGLCADACDAVMDKFSYAKGLIKYKAQNNEPKGLRRHLVYIFITALTLVAMVAWGITRDSFEVNVLRDRQALYRINPMGQVENTFVFKTLNKTIHRKFYRITIAANNNFVINGKNATILDYNVAAGEQASTPVFVVAKSHVSAKQTAITFNVTDINSGEVIGKDSLFYSGEGAW